MAGSRPRLSVIVSTFDRPDALRWVLEGYGRSSYRDFEVIVADDGSSQQTAALVAKLARDAPFALRHVWQPHQGFRLAAARNLAARVAQGEILVMTDGDCIPFEDTLEPHAERCRSGQAQTGERCYLDENETQLVTASGLNLAVIGARARRAGAGRLWRQSWKNRFYSATGLKPRPKLLTANAAVHRDDFERVNGFDERFVGWGYEDEDLARRLRRVGVKILDACRESLVLHLFHPVHESHRPNARASANYHYFKEARYLTRPLAGLQGRRVEDLAMEFLGDVPPPLRQLQVAPGVAPEVSLVFGQRHGAGVITRGEVVLERLEPASYQRSADVYRLLRECFGPIKNSV